MVYSFRSDLIIVCISQCFSSVFIDIMLKLMSFRIHSPTPPPRFIPSPVVVTIFGQWNPLIEKSCGISSPSFLDSQYDAVGGVDKVPDLLEFVDCRLSIHQ